MASRENQEIIIEPSNILQEQLKKAGIDKKLNKIFINWHSIREMCLSVTETILDVIPGQETETLLGDMLLTAVNGWYEVEICDDKARYLAFMQGLLHHAPRVKDWCVYVQPPRGEDIVWDPLGGTLTEWITEINRNPKVAFREEHDPRPPVTDDEYRTIFGARFLHTPDLYVIQEGGFNNIFQGKPS